ncbi:hypothetical protein UA70_28575 [Raoultella planticola]|nr:hypothetical protein UA70_28575 [Raoultella planticola]
MVTGIMTIRQNNERQRTQDVDAKRQQAIQPRGVQQLRLAGEVEDNPQRQAEQYGKAQRPAQHD